MGIFYGFRQVLPYNLIWGKELERTVLGVLSMDCSFDKLFHPFSATKAEGLVEVLRVFSEGVNNVEVLSVENLWVASTDLERSLERAVLSVLPADYFSQLKRLCRQQ